ncbi:TIGR02450 family Trp-rich protein [Halopseudomonas maritima]|uniref:TIGR02450 family Trp-rich protein n=1 Tax=Halopseudomonas maritima TaxID=2918528 RepID=UPI001EEB0E9D|nr:TIGR02450 family Trp-rich protein [Halopseudomonas maritima]UJJ30665.1 TIGR02450 family Trp-rich protein [Halopseudomonas maritima]
MNRINPAKLLHSKWTAVSPVKREKHFMVVEVEHDEEGAVLSCLLEAVLTQSRYSIDWHDLKDTERWRQGWK